MVATVIATHMFQIAKMRTMLMLLMMIVAVMVTVIVLAR